MNKMQEEVAKRMKELKARRIAAIKVNAQHVRDGLLTREEATACITGAMMKAADELGAGPRGGIESYYRLLLDQELDGPDVKLKVGVHI